MWAVIQKGPYLFSLTYIKWVNLLFDRLKKNLHKLNKHLPMSSIETKNNKKINTLDFQTSIQNKGEPKPENCRK